MEICPGKICDQLVLLGILTHSVETKEDGTVELCLSFRDSILLAIH